MVGAATTQIVHALHPGVRMAVTQGEAVGRQNDLERKRILAVHAFWSQHFIEILGAPLMGVTFQEMAATVFDVASRRTCLTKSSHRIEGNIKFAPNGP